MTNVFKVRHGKETHVFRTETPAEKKTLMGMLRQVGDDYNAKRRKEREGEHERRKSMWPGADVSFSSAYTGRLGYKISNSRAPLHLPTG